MWIDEEGWIVRPPETAYPRRPAFLDREVEPADPPHVAARIQAVKKLRIEPEKYLHGLRDWVANGRRSPYALEPDEVVRRSRPRPLGEATAAAHFELGQYLYLAGVTDGAISHFRAAHRLQPDNWTYKRQAWNLEAPDSVRPIDAYGSGWLDDVQALGAENYYPKIIP